MGFLAPKPPPMPKVAPPAQSDVNRDEANKIADDKERRRKKNSSYNQSIRGGAINPAYGMGTKTKQGQ